jgi:ABC-type glutathione transport system ATPase component
MAIEVGRFFDVTEGMVLSLALTRKEPSPPIHTLALGGDYGEHSYPAGPLKELKDVHKDFTMGDTVVQALRGISLQVEQGEYLVVLGPPSGSGKSTLMNIIGCMDTFQEGEYRLMNLPIHEMQDEQLTVIRNRLIGFIFQKYHLVPKYTVLQNVMMPLLVRGVRIRRPPGARWRRWICWKCATACSTSPTNSPAASSSA